jgi:alpha-galactosidase
MKLTCIGASYKFVKNVVNDLILCGEFEDARLIVMDIDRVALDAVVGACTAVIRAGHSRITVSGTLDRGEALDGADFVLIAIGVGGLGLWQREEQACLGLGIVHAIGDTIGPAALSKSLRTVPVMLEIARDMERRCPDAWLLNVTNPMATTVRAIAEHSAVKVIGLCHGSQEMRERIADVYGVDPSDVRYDPVGVNHFVFTDKVLVKGRDVMTTLGEDAAASKSSSLDAWRLGRELSALLGGWLPLTDDRHLVELFPYYVSQADANGRRYGDGPLDVPKRVMLRKAAERRHRDLAVGAEPAREPDTYSGEEIHGILSALHHGEGSRHVVNIPNRGSCPDLPMGAVLEMPALVRRDSVTALSIPEGTLDPPIACLLTTLCVIQDYSVWAAVTGDMGKAGQALFLDPFLQNRDMLSIIPRLREELALINGERR